MFFVKKIKVFSVFLIICLFSSNYVLSENSILSLLPDSTEIKGFTEDDKAQTAKGIELFKLINGGAEVYHEYGFVEALTHSYANEKDVPVSIEIYQMISTKSAFGIYSFKTSTKGKQVKIGDEGIFNDYYLSFYKGSYFINVSGFNSDKETQDAILKMAKAIDKKINSKGKKPDLIKIVLNEKFKYKKVKYLKGQLVFLNEGGFNSKNVLGIKEGICAEYNNFKQFLFKYENIDEAKNIFNKTVSFFNKTGKSAKISNKSAPCFKIDDMFYCIKLSKNYIILVSSVDNRDHSEFFNALEKKLSVNSE